MRKIDTISNEPKQEMSFQTEDGKIIILRFYYVSSQIGWFMDVEYEGTITNCRRITNCPNLLRDKKNIYPFGIACTVEDGEEPWFLDDFKNDRVGVYVLDKSDVEYIEKDIYGKI